MNTSENTLKTGLWIFLLTAAGVLTTFALACATPVAAFAVLAALHMRRFAAAALMIAVWLVGQTIGFGFLHYPLTANTFAWTGALLVCSLMTLEAGFLAARVSAPPPVRAVIVLLAAMLAFRRRSLCSAPCWAAMTRLSSPPICSNISGPMRSPSPFFWSCTGWRLRRGWSRAMPVARRREEGPASGNQVPRILRPGPAARADGGNEIRRIGA